MTRFLLFAAILAFTSCRSLVPLQGKYQDTPLKESYSASFDSVWESVIDFISDTGQEVQLIDKESGIIISDAHITQSRDMSHEDKKGHIINQNALIVAQRYSDEYPRGEVIGKAAFAKWTIRVKKDSQTTASVSALLHVKRIQYLNPKLEDQFEGKSTGNYERRMMDQIKQRVIQTK